MNPNGHYRDRPGYDLTGMESILTGLLEMSDEEARLTVLYRNGLLDALELLGPLREQAEAEEAWDAHRLLTDAEDYLCDVIEGRG